MLGRILKTNKKAVKIDFVGNLVQITPDIK